MYIVGGSHTSMLKESHCSFSLGRPLCLVWCRATLFQIIQHVCIGHWPDLLPQSTVEDVKMAKMLCFPSECICLLFFPSFWLCHVICRILVPWPGIEPTTLAVKAWIPNHWTARVFPCLQFRSEIRQIDKQHSRQTVIRFRKNRKCKKSSKQGKSEWRIMEGFIEEIAFGLTLLRVGWILASTDGRVNFKSGLSLCGQRMAWTQGLNPGLLHCRRILYQLSHKGSPRILEWVACPFSSWSSQPRNWTQVSCIAGGFFTNWATREAPHIGSVNVGHLFQVSSVQVD